MVGLKYSFSLTFILPINGLLNSQWQLFRSVPEGFSAAWLQANISSLPPAPTKAIAHRPAVPVWREGKLAFTVLLLFSLLASKIPKP